jgi:hypothetical protein
MATLSSWLGPVRRLGNAGAVANADRACRQRLQAEASTDADLRKLMARLTEGARKVGQTA